MNEETAVEERLTGKVKFFSQRGFGFLTPTGEEEGSEKGIFFHCSNLQGRTIEPGEFVSYEVAPGREEGTSQAVNIKRIREGQPEEEPEEIEE